jgi:hypothetical protein
MTNAATSPAPTQEDAYAALRVIKHALTQSATTDSDFLELFGKLEQIIDAAGDLMEVRRATRMVLSLFKAFPMLDAIRLRSHAEGSGYAAGEARLWHQELVSLQLTPGFTARDASNLKAYINGLLSSTSVSYEIEQELETLRSHGMDPDKYEHCEEFELAHALRASPRCASDLCFFASQARVHDTHGDLDVTAQDFFPSIMSFLIEKLEIQRLMPSEPSARLLRSVSDPG